MKKFILPVGLCLTMLMSLNVLAGTPNHSEHKDKNQTAQDNTSKAVNVNNKICPVTNDKVDEKTKVTYEYKGKIYNLCCAPCLDAFKKNPEKYINKAPFGRIKPTT